MRSESGPRNPDVPMSVRVGSAAGADDGWLRAAGARLRVPPAGWRDRSACTNADHDLFVGELSADQETRAKAICRRCHVQDACLAFSIAHGVQYGIWGGLNGPERQRVRKVWSEQLANADTNQAEQSA